MSALFGPVRRDVERRRKTAAVSADPIVQAWHAGDLRWFLQAHQLVPYDKYREWEKRDPSKERGQYARVFVLDIGKRFGKTTLRTATRFEDCMRNPGRSYRYVTAYQKDIEEIVDDVSRVILETCPEHLRPQYKTANKAQPSGFYFPNGSVLKTAGLDKNPDGLRGRASDGDDISEAAFVRHLRYSIKNVLYHQYQRKPWARMCLESSAPVEVDSEYDTLFVEDAILRGAYFFGTIDDNTALSDEEREEFIRAAGGREDPDCQREYFNKRVRDPKRVVVPEYDDDKHVEEVERPEHMHGYVGMDPALRDLCGILGAYWHYERAQLIVTHEWAEDNAGTNDIAAALTLLEQDAFAGSTYWHKIDNHFAPNPYARISDTELRLIVDLARGHGIQFRPTSKKDGKEASFQFLRKLFADDKIRIHPRCVKLRAQLKRGMWNERRTDFERTEGLGHLDLMDALKYLARAVERDASPYRPVLPETNYHGTTWERDPPPSQADADAWKRGWYGGGR